MNKETSHIDILLDYLTVDVFPSLKSIRVISYFFVSALLIGGAGIWLPWMKGEEIELFPGSNVFTYVFALLGSLLCNRLYFNIKQFQDIRGVINGTSPELSVSDSVDNIINDFNKHSILSAWAMIFGSVILIIVSCSYVFNYDKSSCSGFFAFILSAIFYLFSTARDIENKTNPNLNKDGQNSDVLIPINENPDEEFNSRFFQEGK